MNNENDPKSITQTHPDAGPDQEAEATERKGTNGKPKSNSRDGDTGTTVTPGTKSDGMKVKI